jgi:hypothetical protein
MATDAEILEVVRPRSHLLADAIVAALGMNVWASLVLTPGLFVGSFAHARGYGLLAGLALVPFAVGLVRRSAAWLLLAYPLALLGPLAVDPRAVSTGVYGPLAFVLAAIGLAGYLLVASWATAPSARTGAPQTPRRLPAPASPPRWNRRVRVYVYLVVLSIVFPAVLLWVVDFSSTTREFVRELYKDGRDQVMGMVMNVGVLGLWFVLYLIAFVEPLRLHRTGDRPLVRKIESIRRDALRGTPNPIFYAAVICALGFMGLLIYLRYR